MAVHAAHFVHTDRYRPVIVGSRPLIAHIEFIGAHLEAETLLRHGTKLTDQLLLKLPLPAKGAVIHADQTLTGFGVRVTAGGVRTFVLTYGRERRRISIGRVGVISLSDARKEAKRYLASETLGKRSCRSVRWKAGVEEYLAEVEQNRKPRTHKDYKRLLGRFDFPGLLTDIHPQDVVRKLDKLLKFPAEKLHAFAALRQFFNWAYRKHYLEVSPMARMQQPKTPVSRDRVLTDDEMKKIWNACGDDTFGRVVKLLILTGMRRGEVSAMSANMIGDGCIILPGEVTKNGRDLVLPITETMKPLLVFPLKWGGWSKSKTALDERSGVKGWRLHDLRRTFRTGMGSLRVPPHIGERLVNHISAMTDVEAIYDRFKYLEEKREALEKWSAHVLAITQEAPEGASGVYKDYELPLAS
jgi:integrase